MSAFYGGRAEARIVSAPVPVALVDFTSMYPSVNALLNTRSLLTAERIRVEDATDRVRAMLARPDLAEWYLTPKAWREIGVTLVELEPRGAVLPVRGKYDPTSGDYGIGVNPYTYEGRVWYALPDVLAAAVLTPDEDAGLEVVRAVRLVDEGTQESLRPANLRGGRQLDPRRDDPFLAMIEERHRLRDTDARQERFLKVTANSTTTASLPASTAFSGEVADAAEYRAEYGARDDPWPMVVTAIRQLSAGAVARRSGLDRRTIQRAVREQRDPTTPHRANRARIADATAAEAAIRLEAIGRPPPGGTLPTLLAYLRYSDEAGSSVPE